MRLLLMSLLVIPAESVSIVPTLPVRFNVFLTVGWTDEFLFCLVLDGIDESPLFYLALEESSFCLDLGETLACSLDSIELSSPL